MYVGVNCNIEPLIYIQNVVSILLCITSQDDVVLGTLSVRENLSFSAALRLPRETTGQQRKERVDKVINELGLQSCANTKVPMLHLALFSL